MNESQKNIILLVFLVFILFVVNYPFIDKALINFFDEGETVIVERVIDGDTIVVNGTSVRFLGINSPEKGEQYSKEAKEFLEELILNKNIKLEFGKDKYDRYKRILGYVYFEGKNVNLELVENGFANFYFPSGKDIYYNDFLEAWEECVEKNINFCEKSADRCANCIKLNEFDYRNQVASFGNICNFDCELTGWTIKDEGRKNFIFPKFVLKGGEDIEVIVTKEGKENTGEKLFWNVKTYVWTNSGDTLFLRDEKGKLILWENY